MTTHSGLALRDLLDEATRALRQIIVAAEAPRHELDAADRVYWALRRARDDLDGDLLRAGFVARAVVNETETIGLGRLERWQEENFCPALSELYGFCSVYRDRSTSPGAST